MSAGRTITRVRHRVATALPDPVRVGIRDAAYRARWGFPRPPIWSDWSEYERLLQVVDRKQLAQLPGDVVEIGVLLGGGTYKLCKYFERAAPEKRVYAIDVFDPGFDITPSTEGPRMSEVYTEALAGRSQREVFDEITRSCPNLEVIAGDSAKVALPTDQVVFAYIDGNHAAEYVRSDFELVWSKLSPGGLVAFDDYGEDHPAVTQTVHALVGEHAGEIRRVWAAGWRTFFVERAS